LECGGLAFFNVKNDSGFSQNHTWKDYVILSDAVKDKTTMSGNTVTPAGAISSVVHKQTALRPAALNKSTARKQSVC
jgi:hypothetical protein